MMPTASAASTWAASMWAASTWAAGTRDVIADAPAVEDLEAAVYVILKGAPEANGTLAWSETTVVLVTAAQVSAHCAPTLHAHVGARDAEPAACRVFP